MASVLNMCNLPNNLSIELYDNILQHMYKVALCNSESTVGVHVKYKYRIPTLYTLLANSLPSVIVGYSTVNHT